MKPATIHFMKFKILLMIGTFLFSSLFLPVTYAQNTNTEQELFVVAQKAFEDGFYDVAMRYLDQLLENYPGTDKRIKAQHLLGQCYFFKNQYVKAFDIFQNLLSYSELKDAALYWMGETHLKGSGYKEAEALFHKLIDEFPKSTYVPQAYYSLGWLYFEQAQFENSKKAFTKLITQFPTHQLSEDATFMLGESYYHLGSYKESIDQFQSFVLKYPKSSRHAEIYFYMGEAHYYLEDWLRAVTFYAKAADLSLDNKLILMSKISMGWCYLNLKKYDLAQKHFDQALAFSNEKNILSDDVYLGQANLYSETQQYTKAIEAYGQLIDLFPNSERIADALLGKANTYYLLQNYQKAIGSYSSLITRLEQHKTHVDILEKSYFGLAWSHLKMGDINKSVEIFTKIKNTTTNKTTKISALTQIGDAYHDSGRLNEAIEIYDNILKTYPESFYADYVQYRQGIALLKLGKIESGTLSFQSLKANFPTSKYINETKYYLAVAYFKKQNWTQAKNQAQDFIQSVTEYNEYLPEASYILGLCQLYTKDYKAALNQFQNLIKNFPQNSTLVRSSELNTARALFQLKEEKEAVKRFRLLVTKYPQDEVAEEALIWLGDYAMTQNQFSEAIIYYEQFIQNYPKSENIDLVLYEVGQAYNAEKSYDKAVNSFKKVSNKNRDILVKAQISIAEIFTKDLNTASALETYQNIIQSSPEFQRDAYIKIAEVHKKDNNYSKAIAAYKSALSSAKALSQISDAEIQFKIADTHETSNKDKQAIDEYLKIPYLYPKAEQWVIKSYLRIAKIFEEQEKWEEAVITYKKIIQFNQEESKFAKERLDWIKENALD